MSDLPITTNSVQPLIITTSQPNKANAACQKASEILDHPWIQAMKEDFDNVLSGKARLNVQGALTRAELEGYMDQIWLVTVAGVVAPGLLEKIDAELMSKHHHRSFMSLSAINLAQLDTLPLVQLSETARVTDCVRVLLDMNEEERTAYLGALATVAK